MLTTIRWTLLGISGMLAIKGSLFVIPFIVGYVYIGLHQIKTGQF